METPARIHAVSGQSPRKTGVVVGGTVVDAPTADERGVKSVESDERITAKMMVWYPVVGRVWRMSRAISPPKTINNDIAVMVAAKLLMDIVFIGLIKA